MSLKTLFLIRKISVCAANDLGSLGLLFAWLGSVSLYYFSKLDLQIFRVACILAGVAEDELNIYCCIHPFLLPGTTTAAPSTLTATNQSSQVTTKDIACHSPDAGNPAVGRQGLCQQCCFALMSLN